MSDDARRLTAIEAAVALVRAALLDDGTPVDIEVDPDPDVVIALARFAAVQTTIAAGVLRSTPIDELDDYLARARDALGQSAPIVPIKPE